MTDQFDIAVLGAGPAGANAALAAAKQGARVVMIDEQPHPGGQVWRAKSDAILNALDTTESISGNDLRMAIDASEIAKMENSRLWQIERDSNGWALQILRDGRNHPVRAKALVLATGAKETVQPIPGWTTPGVLGLAGATAMFKQNLQVPGQATIVSGTGPLVFFVASEIRRLGGAVSAVVTPNSRSDWARALPAMLTRPDLLARGAVWIADLILARVPIYWRHATTRIKGDTGVSGATIQSLDAQWAPDGRTVDIKADSICLGNGLSPSTEAAQLAGLPLDHNETLGGWIPNAADDGTTEIPGLFLCGDGAGIRGAAAAVLHGTRAGLAAAAFTQGTAPAPSPALRRRQNRAARFGMAMTALSIPRPGLAKLTTPDAIICRCESVTAARVKAEIMAGAESTMSVKSGLRAGMGPCGGKFCQSAMSQLIASTKNIPISDIPPTTARPPLRPVPVDAIAGDFDYDDLPIPKPAPL